MTLNKGQQILGWGILIACALSIPAGLLGKSSNTPAEKSESKSSLSSLLADKDRIAVVRIGGMIYDDEGESSFFPQMDSPTGAKKRIRKAIKDKHIKAILLRINSPGGTVGTSQDIYQSVRDFRDAGKPIVASMGDVAASGGYYIAAGADKIFAQPGTLTGSIGVIMHLMNLAEIEKKIGIQSVVVKSGQFKDIGSMDRAMTPEEKTILQNIIMDSYDQFVQAIVDGRKMEKDTVKKLADGRIYSGRQAKAVNLVDELGSYEDAIEYLQKTCKEKYKLKEDLTVDDGRPMSLLASLLESGLRVPPPSAQQAGLLKGLVPQSLDPKFCNQPLWLKE